MTKAIYSIVPARQGSKGVKGKNAKLLGGHPLFAYSVAISQLVPEIERVYVSTDSEEYAEEAEKYGAKVILRPAEISGDTSTDYEFVRHALDHLQKEEGEPELLVHLRPTTPLRDPKLVSSAISEFLKNKEATSLRSAHVAPESPLKWFKKGDDGYFEPFSQEVDRKDLNSARQGFEDVFVPNGYVDILRTSFVNEKSEIHGDKIASFETPFCVEIDTTEEFEFLEYWIEKKGSFLKEHMDGKING